MQHALSFPRMLVLFVIGQYGLIGVVVQAKKGGFGAKPQSTPYIRRSSHYRVGKVYYPENDKNNHGGNGNHGVNGDPLEVNVYYSSHVGTPVPSHGNHLGLWTLIRDSFALFPSLAATVAACLAVFTSWQVPAGQQFLQKWFVTSHYNLSQGRWPSLVLSAVSHASWQHLLINLLTLLSFGPAVQRSLQSTSLQKWPIWPLLLGSALAGSTAFLAWQNALLGLYNTSSKRGQFHMYRPSAVSGSLGLSAVTCALVAVFGCMNPTAQLRFRVAGVFPVTMTAQVMLPVMLGTTLVSLALQPNSTIDHAGHLGGTLFGLVYYAVWKRRYQWRWRIRQFLRKIALAT